MKEYKTLVKEVPWVQIDVSRGHSHTPFEQG